MTESPILFLGVILAAAVVGGGLARLVRMPRVVGYLLAGIGLRLVLGIYISDSGQAHLGRQLRPLNDLALGLILFSIGAVFERAHLRSVGWRVLRISAAEAGLTALLVLVVCWAASGDAMVGSFMAAMAVATAPAATLLVLREYEAKGPTTDHLLTLTGLNNIWSIVLFYLVFLVVGAMGRTHVAPERSLPLDLILMTAGSAAIGIGLGLVLSIVQAAASPAAAITLFLAILVSLETLLSAAQQHYHLAFNHLLICLAMGATFANEAINPDRLNNMVASIAAPIFAAFFVLAGYDLHVQDLPHLGLLGAGYCLMRVAGKFLGCRLGLRWAHGPEEIRGGFGLGLTCQAGVAIGLAGYLARHLGQMQDGVFVADPAALQMSGVILASVTIFELIGPLLVKQVAVKAGEVKAISLLPRPSAAVADTRQVAGSIVRSIMRTLRGGRHRPADATGKLRVRDIMRSNVRSLAPGATLTEVMRFVERSRFNEFPVAEQDGRLIGVIELSDIRGMIYDPIMRDLITAVDLADTRLDPAVVDQSLEELLERFAHLNTGCLPVVDNLQTRRLVGIVEQRDLLQALH